MDEYFSYQLKLLNGQTGFLYFCTYQKNIKNGKILSIEKFLSSELEEFGTKFRFAGWMCLCPVFKAYKPKKLEKGYKC